MKKFRLTTTQLILLSFLFPIFIGSFLLALPISAANGQAVSYLDALFTATTSTCVTGLVTVPTFSTWSLFGQGVILLLIQIGGLGVITILSGVMLLLHQRIGLNSRLLIQDAFNLNTLSGLVKFVKKVFLGTLLIEGIGAVLYLFVFVPEFGLSGVWISIFNSVSAFCNAGIDIIGANSLEHYVAHPLVNLVTSVLIILGGLGYIVWWDVLRVLKERTPQNHKIFRRLTLHSKIALTMTGGLILGGGILLLLFEAHNPLTFGPLSWFGKIQAALFQSVTTRTAGFASVPQQNLTQASSFLSILLMLIGGSPVGTAGGMKTVTLAVLCCSAIATFQNRKHVSLFGRRVSEESLRKAIAVVIAFLGICFLSTLLLLATNDGPPLDLIYETVSAAATVGLSKNLTAQLNHIGKIILIVTMYLGRVSPLSLAIALRSENTTQNLIADPTEEISIG